MTTEQPPANRSTWRRSATQAVVALTLTAAVLFISAGTLQWWNAWVFLGFMLALTVVMGFIFARSPGLAEERATAAARARSWDTVLVPALSAVLPMLMMVLAGLDRRLGWTLADDAWAPPAGLCLMVAGTALTAWAMDTNRFFSSHVRIQHDRGHTVVSSGPYRYVRHPGYLGSILYNAGIPLLLGSHVALLPALLFGVVTVIRTSLEDAVLRAELDGYAAYATTVRQRLFPGLW